MSSDPPDFACQIVVGVRIVNNYYINQQMKHKTTKQQNLAPFNTHFHLSLLGVIIEYRKAIFGQRVTLLSIGASRKG